MPRELGFKCLWVYDDLSGKVRPIDEVIKSVKSKHIPYFWYVNIHASKDNS